MADRSIAPPALRLARPDERAALEALQWRASLTNEGDRAALLAHPDAIVLPDEQIAAGQVVVAEAHGTILGFAAILPRADTQTELDGLFVEPEAMGCGIGRRLVEACAELARSRGSRCLHVIANPHAAAFYERCGFEPVGTAETRFGPAMTLKKRL